MSELGNEARLVRLTDYWRRSQVAAALETLKDTRDRDTIRSLFSHGQFRAGVCPAAVYVQAFAKIDEAQDRRYAKLLERNPSEPRPPREPYAAVVFSPFGLHLDRERNGIPISVVYGFAKVDRKGHLVPSAADGDMPSMWVGRPCLEPTDWLDDGTFPIAEADRYYDAVESKRRQIEEWPLDWAGALAAFDEIWAESGGPSPLFEHLADKYRSCDGWIRFDEQDAKRLTIVKMFERVLKRLEKSEDVPLYRELLLGEHRRVFAGGDPSLHLGHMNDEYALAPSQRSSLLAYLQTPVGRIAAVNGPPGSGKTTLLQSVVATDFVKAAISGDSSPPIFIATSSTNQAVSNVTKAFRDATESIRDPLADRWIPGIGRRYGIYFRASTDGAVKLAEGSVVCLPTDLNKAGECDDASVLRLIASLEERNAAKQEVPVQDLLYIAESEAVRRSYLKAASQHFGTVQESVETAVAMLRDQLAVVVGGILDYASAARTVETWIRRHGFAGCVDYPDAERKAFESLNDARTAFEAESHRVAVENAADDENEARLRAGDESELEAFDSEHERVWRATRPDEDATLAYTQRELRIVDALVERFRPLGEAYTAWAWVQDTCFPWVRARKAAGLRALLTDMNIDVAPADRNLVSLRDRFHESIEDRSLRYRRVGEAIAAARSDREAEYQTRRTQRFGRVSSERERRAGERRLRDDRRSRELAVAKDACEASQAASDELVVAWRRLREVSVRVLGNDPPSAFAALNDPLDKTLRVRAFLLATHYWEGRFLLSVRASGWRNQQNRRKAFRVMAMILPCFVCTFDKLGLVFNIMQSRGLVSPMWELADTLIVDEAGQASPDKSAFAFAFAKKALVVGDNKQLPPVDPTDAKLVTSSLAIHCGLDLDKALADRGLLVGQVGVQRFPGSLMRMASAAAWFDMSPETKGMWLREHFRCDERIIAYCNEVWYTGETALIPSRVMPDIPAPLPHFGHLNVNGRTINNRNFEEARAIMEWIDRHGRMLTEHYSRGIEGIVAVLTPFKKQKLRLEQLREQYRWSDLGGDPHSIVMGTVHALQGAERPVVLFSTVYDSVRDPFFFDREHTMLNVAVSRAQDSFIVVGDSRIFGRRIFSGARPSTVLARYIFDPSLSPLPPLAVEGTLRETLSAVHSQPEI